MKKIKINAKKQDNGLWGIPYYCGGIDTFILLDDRKELIFSASLVAIAEYYKSNFTVFNSTDKAYFVKIRSSNYKIVYDRYEVVDDILYEFENDDEHKVFLRKQKIQKINNYERINL